MMWLVTVWVIGFHVTGLNAIPLLEEYRSKPKGNIHLLLTGLGAVAGQLTNIDTAGQPSMGFHGDPELMHHDPYRCSKTRVSTCTYGFARTA